MGMVGGTVSEEAEGILRKSRMWRAVRHWSLRAEGMGGGMSSQVEEEAADADVAVFVAWARSSGSMVASAGLEEGVRVISST